MQADVHERTTRLPARQLQPDPRLPSQPRDSYNWIDFIVLSLYLASYVLRLLVSHTVLQADRFYSGITARSRDQRARSRDALAARDFRLYNVIVNETFGNRSSTVYNYFMKACTPQVDVIGRFYRRNRK